jgi:hypothetical protein
MDYEKKQQEKVNTCRRFDKEVREGTRNQTFWSITADKRNFRLVAVQTIWLGLSEGERMCVVASGNHYWSQEEADKAVAKLAAPDPRACYNAVIEFVLLTGDLDFLRLWNSGEFGKLRKEWPEAPDACFRDVDPEFVPYEFHFDLSKGLEPLLDEMEKVLESLSLKLPRGDVFDIHHSGFKLRVLESCKNDESLGWFTEAVLHAAEEHANLRHVVTFDGEPFTLEHVAAAAAKEMDREDMACLVAYLIFNNEGLGAEGEQWDVTAYPG